MNITHEESAPLEACIRLEITPDDYQEKVNHKLKDYQKKANIPGFRPGHIPFGLVNKMYGKALLAEEINTLISESLSNYIKDNKLETLGSPLANEEKTPRIEWEDNMNLEFYFDIGLTPQFDAEIDEKLEVEYLKIQAEEDQVEKEIETIRRSYGTFAKVEESIEGDWLTVEMNELDAEGNKLEGGISHSRRITAITLKDEESRKKLIGLTVGDRVVFNPLTAAGDASSASYLLSITIEKAEEITSDFEMNIQEIERLEPALMNEELFNKVFPGQNIATEEDFRSFVKQDIEKSYSDESDVNFFGAVRKKLIETLDLQLPENFLKKWLMERNNGKVPEHEPDYRAVFETMKWQLIENKIILKYDLAVEEDEVKEFVKTRYREYFQSQTSIPEGDEGTERILDSLAEKYLEKQEDAEKIYDQLYFRRLLSLFLDKVTMKTREVNHEEFHKLDESNHHHH